MVQQIKQVLPEGTSMDSMMILSSELQIDRSFYSYRHCFSRMNRFPSEYSVQM